MLAEVSVLMSKVSVTMSEVSVLMSATFVLMSKVSVTMSEVSVLMSATFVLMTSTEELHASFRLCSCSREARFEGFGCFVRGEGDRC
jgi:hypothetical protein